MAEWICDGVPKDGKIYPDRGGVHEPLTNQGADCPECGLPKESMSATTKIIGGSEIPIKAILGAVAVLAALVTVAFVGRSIFSDGCPQGTEKIADVCTDPYLKVHEAAIADGESALAIISRYRSTEDLEQAQQYLNSAIESLAGIPESALVYAQAQTKLNEYDRLAVDVGNVINNFQLCAIEPKPDDCLF